MTLNILMTFAQFERETTSDRIRDKIAASKKKGMWKGGQVPYGYVARNKRLYIKDSEAPIVKEIFNLYSKLGVTMSVARELNRRGYKTRNGINRTGNSVGAIITNPTYKGKIAYRGEIFQGEHAPTIDTELWETVNKVRGEQLNSLRKYGQRTRNLSLAPLKGILRCGHCGSAMTPTARTHRGAKYNYYVRSKTNKAQIRCLAARIPAAQAEEAVFSQIVELLKTDAVINKIAFDINTRLEKLKDVFANITEFWDMFFPVEKTKIIKLLVTSAVLNDDSMDIKLNLAGAKELVEEVYYESEEQ